MSVATLSPARLAYLNKRVRRAQDIIPDSLEAMKLVYSQGMSLVWEQEGDIGPVEVFEMLGTEGASLFAEGVQLLTFILSKDPTWEYPAPTHEFTINEDGTVTIGENLAAKAQRLLEESEQSED